MGGMRAGIHSPMARAAKAQAEAMKDYEQRKKVFDSKFEIDEKLKRTISLREKQPRRKI